MADNKSLRAFKSMVTERLLNLNIAFLGRVIAYSDKTASVQPLNLIKQYGEEPQKQAIIQDVPVLKSARPLAVGDTVFCVCSDRDISHTRNGGIALPDKSCCEINDAVVVGVI